MGNAVPATRRQQARGVPYFCPSNHERRMHKALAVEAGQAAALRYAGKLSIHPYQIAAVHETFRLTPERLSWAPAALDALGTSDTGVEVVGRVVDRAHLKLANRYIVIAKPDMISE